MARCQIDVAQLSELSFDAEDYGRALSASLFADPAVRSAFAQARSSAASLDAALRLRLLIGPSAPELHGLRWETLRDPEDDAPLLTGEHILFSRYLNSGDWRPVKLRPKGELRALVAVANPSDLAKYKLATVDVAGELERARAGLVDIPVMALSADPRAARSRSTTWRRDCAMASTFSTWCVTARWCAASHGSGWRTMPARRRWFPAPSWCSACRSWPIARA